jgi:hypothetical protein
VKTIPRIVSHVTGLRRFLTVFALATLCAACVTNHTTDQYAKDYVNRCFTTRTEAILLSRECSKGAWKYCDTVQPISPDIHMPQFDYPPTLQAFHEDPDGWTRRIDRVEMRRQPRLEPDHLVVYGGLPKGTELQVIELKSDSNYEVGTTWTAYAIVQNGEFHGRRLLLPTGDSVVDWKYVARCNSDTAVPDKSR